MSTRISASSALALERQRTQSAEAEVARLRAQLASVAMEAVRAGSGPPDTIDNLQEAIDQFRQLEQRLEDQQELVRQVIDASPNLVSVEDADGQVIMVNKSYAHLLSWTDLRSRPDDAPGSAAWPRLPHTEEELSSMVEFEECYHLLNGETRWYRTSQGPLLRSDGTRYLITFSSDITALKQATRMAEESVQIKQLFMAHMSHEIRTPLHGVMGLADLLMKESLTPEQADYVEIIQSSTQNLLVVINDILDFAKIESGNIVLEKIPFDIVHTVQDAFRSLMFKANEKGLLLRVVEPNEPLPLALGDPYRLRQVLVNLVGNAIKFTDQGAITITIDASQRAGLALPVTFSIADTGMGISIENLEHVFSSYQQAESSTQRIHGGTGLGLSICRNLIELQGGQIGARSELGQGSCFYFTIPYTVSAEPLVREQTTIPDAGLLRGLNILFAEDNAVNQLIAVSMLNQWHVKVDMAQNGEEALIRARQRPYDLILMDVQMPLMNGTEATALLRAEPGPNQYTPIVALTADAVRVNTETCRTLGFTEFLTKPYTELSLYKMLAYVSHRATVAPPQQAAPEGLGASAELGLHYDFEMLGKLADDPGFIRKMLELFISRVPEQVLALQQAVAQENWEAISREAHGLKATFGTLNIQPEVGSLKMVEELAELRAPKEEITPFVEAVRKGAQLFSALFAEELAKLPTQE